MSEVNTITTAVPFLLIDEDARVPGFGNISCVSSDDYLNTGTWSNPALLSRRKKSTGVSFTYAPWLKIIIDDIYIYNANLHFSINNRNTVALHYRYFDLGYMKFTDLYGTITDTIKPVEYAVKLSFAHHFKKGFSLGLNVLYFLSDLTRGSHIINNEYKPAKSYAFGFGWNYDNSIYISENADVLWSIGGSVNNLGPKIAYFESDTIKDFIPANLAIGVILSPTFYLPGNFKLSFDLAYEAEKLLVPSPPRKVYDPVGNEYQIVAGMDPDVPVFQSYYQSFYDAPGGNKEELHEVIHQFGAEVRINGPHKLVAAFRHGYFNEHETKGNRKLYTTGFTLGYRGFEFNIGQNIGVKNSIKRHDWFLQLGYIYQFTE